MEDGGDDELSFQNGANAEIGEYLVN